MQIIKKQEQPRVFSFPSSPAPQGPLTMVLLFLGYSPILSVDSCSAWDSSPSLLPHFGGYVELCGSTRFKLPRGLFYGGVCYCMKLCIAFPVMVSPAPPLFSHVKFSLVMNQPKNPSPGTLLCMLTLFRTHHWLFIAHFGQSDPCAGIRSLDTPLRLWVHLQQGKKPKNCTAFHVPVKWYLRQCQTGCRVVHK